MLISDLINRLEEYKQQFGDIEIYNLSTGEEVYCLQIEDSCENVYATIE